MGQRLNHGKETKVLGKLGINESYQLAMYLLDQYRGTVLTCRYEIPPRLASAEARPQMEEAVKVAVVDTIMRHPMMQIGMKDATSKSPSWIQLQSLDLTQHIKWVDIKDHDDFEQIVQETFCAKIDERFPDLSIKQPGWWVTVIRQGDAPMMEVLLSWNSSQFDGAGAKVFHEDVIEMLNAGNEKGARAGLDGDILKLPRASPLLPTPIERSRGLPVDPKYLAKFRAFFTDQASLSAILVLCRKNKTTITGLIHGLALIAFSSHLNSTGAPAFQSSTIMDHRRNLPPAPAGAPWARSDRTVANYVTRAFHKYGIKTVARIRSKLKADAGKGGDLSADLQRELWAASARSRQDIVRRLEAGLRNDLVGVFKYVTDWQKTMSDQAKKKRQFSWLVTNIGVLEGGNSSAAPDTTAEPSPTDGDNKSDDVQKWSISRAQFGLSAEIPAAAIEFSPVSVAGRGMCVSASWPDCAVDTVLGERIMADMERWLAQLASQP
ncbi:Alcohol acetyltransferase [Diaporthe eres]|uniref:Alcohol acetyltransferase n=1 Tax=Diaporthe eres TaxID=83184 RepID=A0ABR1NS64_DIAER